MWIPDPKSSVKDPPQGGIPLRTGNAYIHLSALPKAIEGTYPEISGRYEIQLKINQLKERKSIC